MEGKRLKYVIFKIFPLQTRRCQLLTEQELLQELEVPVKEPISKAERILKTKAAEVIPY